MIALSITTMMITCKKALFLTIRHMISMLQQEQELFVDMYQRMVKRLTFTIRKEIFKHHCQRQPKDPLAVGLLEHLEIGQVEQETQVFRQT